MRVPKKETLVLVDGLDCFLRCLLSQETVILPKGAFDLGLLGKRKVPFGPGEPV